MKSIKPLSSLWASRVAPAERHSEPQFIAVSRNRYTRVAHFIDNLNAEAHEHYRQLREAADPKSPFYLAWLRDHRNVTSHIPELHPMKYERGTERMANAIEAAAGLEGRVTHNHVAATVRFGFADVVGVQLLPWDDPNVMKHLGRARIALGGFVHEALEAYMLGLPRGTVTVEP